MRTTNKHDFDKFHCSRHDHHCEFLTLAQASHVAYTKQNHHMLCALLQVNKHKRSFNLDALDSLTKDNKFITLQNWLKRTLTMINLKPHNYI